VQFRHACQLTAEEYRSQRFWELARLESCPLHPKGGCGFSRHGSYGRVEPPGTRIARFRCLLARVTFSLLPDCFASRVKGRLIDIEQIADQVERQDGTLEELAVRMRPVAQSDPDGDHVAGTLKWMRRRRRWVTAALTIALGLLPEKLAGRQPTLADFRAALGVEQVLLALRELLAPHLAQLPPPLGFGPRSIPRKKAAHRLQHESGPDPPDAAS
jgi:hypothetical protein